MPTTQELEKPLPFNAFLEITNEGDDKTSKPNVKDFNNMNNVADYMVRQKYFAATWKSSALVYVWLGARIDEDKVSYFWMVTGVVDWINAMRTKGTRLPDDNENLRKALVALERMRGLRLLDFEIKRITQLIADSDLKDVKWEGPTTQLRNSQAISIDLQATIDSTHNKHIVDPSGKFKKFMDNSFADKTDGRNRASHWNAYDNARKALEKARAGMSC
jgi:hypothetical protein